MQANKNFKNSSHVDQSFNQQKRSGPKLASHRPLKRTIITSNGKEIVCFVKPLTRHEEKACDQATD